MSLLGFFVTTAVIIAMIICAVFIFYKQNKKVKVYTVQEGDSHLSRSKASQGHAKSSGSRRKATESGKNTDIFSVIADKRRASSFSLPTTHSSSSTN
jgi:uncharacterized protein YxeA